MSNYRTSRRGLYRSRNGAILGVCRGLAEYFDFSVFWVRAAVVVLVIFTHFWLGIGLYVLAALLMKSESHIGAGHRPASGFEKQHCRSKHEMAERLKRKWQHLEKRIRRMEDKVTSPEFDWNRRFHS